MKTTNLYGKEQSVHEQVEAETRFVLRSRCALGKYIHSDNVGLADCSCVLFNKMVIYAPLIIQLQSAPGRSVLYARPPRLDDGHGTIPFSGSRRRRRPSGVSLDATPPTNSASRPTVSPSQKTGINISQTCVTKSGGKFADFSSDIWQRQTYIDVLIYSDWPPMDVDGWI